MEEYEIDLTSESNECAAEMAFERRLDENEREYIEWHKARGRTVKPSDGYKARK